MKMSCCSLKRAGLRRSETWTSWRTPENRKGNRLAVVTLDEMKMTLLFKERSPKSRIYEVSSE